MFGAPPLTAVMAQKTPHDLLFASDTAVVLPWTDGESGSASAARAAPALYGAAASPSALAVRLAWEASWKRWLRNAGAGASSPLLPPGVALGKRGSGR